MSAPTTISDAQPPEKIFLTAKTRMTSEANLRRRASVIESLIIWYSFVLVALSLLDLTRSYVIPNFSVISVICSTALLALSAFSQGKRDVERANSYKDCYLKLQSLYNSEISDREKMTEYARILLMFENQSDTDYDEMLFTSFLRGQKLYNAKGPVRISFFMALKVLIVKIARLATGAVLFALPVLAAYYFH